MQDMPTSDLPVATLPKANGTVVVSHSNTGTNLVPEVIPPSFLASATTKSNRLGSCLSIGRTIVEADHGRIWAGPSSGGGTVSSFTLPTSRPEGSIDVGCMTVHVVDDDLTMRQTIGVLLATAGIGVRLYDSASTFLAILGNALPGCVVTDVQMPVIDGLELLNRLKAAGSSLPVIVMTGHGNVALAVRAMRAGAVDFIEKPFDAELFLRVVTTSFKNVSVTVPGAVATRGKLESLSRRERQVLDGIFAGKHNKIIAQELGLSPRTIEIYRAKVMAKTGATNVPDLIRAVLASES